MVHPDVTLAILAGGRATRLGGVPKGLLELDGEPFLQRQLRLGADFAEVLVVANDAAPYAGFGARVVGDVVANRGAPGGVHAALTHARTGRIVVIGADMPFVTAVALERLLSTAGKARLACFERGGHLEPLLGVYARSLLGDWARLLAQQPSFRELFSALGGTALPEETLRSVDPELCALVNVNRREDLARWKIDWPIGWKGAQVAADDGAGAD